MHASERAQGGVSNAVTDGLWGAVDAVGLPYRRARAIQSDEEAYDFVEDAAASAAEWLPGLGFLAPNGILDVPVDPAHAKVTGLRLELPPGEPLRLQSIGLATEDRTDVVRLTTVTASSWHPGYAQRFDLARLLDADHPSGVVVRTAEDEGPAWVELRFAHPVRLTRITVRNVDSTKACRAFGLRITAFGRFRKQHTVYDGSADLRDLDSLLGLARAVAFTNPLLAALMAPLELALRGHYPAALAAFSGLGLDDEDWRRFREVLNTELLVARGHEWGADDVKAAAPLGSAA